MKQIRESNPPQGLMRWLARLPTGLYRVGLGGLLGSRFLLIEHRGRRSGLTRRTVVEVVRHDPDADAWIVASGWGERAQWFRNLQADPRARVTHGRRRCGAAARPLSPSEAEREMLDYGHRNPRAVRAVARFSGYEIDATDADIRAFAGCIRLIELRCASPDAARG